jgi:cytochrome c-type biogenesis protein CcmH
MKAVVAFLLMMVVPALAAPTPPKPASAPATATAESFADPAMEARAHHLQRQLRCLICQGESIDESGSSFAVDVRRLVHEQIAAGQSDRQIQDFFVARYGDSILMKPPIEPDTWLLWFAPFAVLAVAGGVAWITIKKAAKAAA